MFYNTNINELSHSIDNAPEKVYVDWPEENNEDYRFVSSRMDDVESEFHHLVDAEHIKSGIDVTGNIGDLRVGNKPPRPKENKRYEDLSRYHQRSRQKNSSIPPLDLISQHSSIEIPGAKGIIDIDFRSTSDTMSEDSEQADPQEEVDRDSLEGDLERYKAHNVVFNGTTLPEVMHEDLILNHGEYNSSRYHSNNVTNRKFSDISVPLQYKVASMEPHHSHYEASDFVDKKQDDQAAFEAVQQRFKRTLSTKTHEHILPSKQDRSSATSLSKVTNTKPTMLVAPQIKQSFHEKSPNFIELNKVALNQPKQIYQSSYATKYADRQRKDSPKRSHIKAIPTKEASLQTHNHTEKVDKNPTLSSQDYWSKRERSVERLTGEHNDYREESQEQMQRNMFIQNNPRVIYAYTQYEEPLFINPGEIIHGGPKSSEIHHHMYHVPSTEYYSQNNVSSHIYNTSATSPRVQRQQNQSQETRRSLDATQILKDAPYKRQPTLYDEKLLEKKTRIASSDRITSHFPPLPGSSDSNISLNNGNSYAASLRKKEVTYEQYTLRDFRNIKQINSVGGLGPNLGTESHKQMRDKLVRQKNYSKAVKEKNQELLKRRDNEVKDQQSSNMNRESSNGDHKEVEENESLEEKSFRGGSADFNLEPQLEDKMSKSKSSFPSANSNSREQVAKRDVMMNYAKSIKQKQIKKLESKSKNSEPNSAKAMKNQEVSKIAHELFNNSDLDRLLQRHEYDKKMSDQLRQKLEKIP